jgi:hypothetical protein
VSDSIAPVRVMCIVPVISRHSLCIMHFYGTSLLTAGPPNYRCKGDGCSNVRDVEPVDHLGPQAPRRTVGPLTGPRGNRWKEKFNFRTVNGLQAPSPLQVQRKICFDFHCAVCQSYQISL